MGGRNIEVVYVLQHVRQDGDDEDVKFIGVYTSEINAMDAKKRFASITGFNRYPDGFFIDKYVLDKDHWSEGF